MQRVVRDRDALLLSAVQQCTLCRLFFMYTSFAVITAERERANGLYSYFCIDDGRSDFCILLSFTATMPPFLRATTNDPGTEMSVYF